MDELRVTLEMNTPALAGGSQPRSCDPYFRMRPSAVRGGLRHWFRAVAASLLWPETAADAREQSKKNECMVRQLAALEASVFGKTEQCSSVVVLPPVGGTLSPWPNPGKDDPGLAYLGYGVFGRNHKPPQRLSTAPGKSIDLRLCFRRTARKTPPNDPLPPGLDVLVPAVAASLWLWTAFGGYGARWRRGFGSMRLARMDLSPDAHRPDLLRRFSQLLDLPQTNEDHLRCLSRGIGLAQDAIRNLANATELGHTLLQNNGTAPHPNIRTIDGIKNLRTLIGTTTQATDALEAAGAALLNYRSSLARTEPLPDYHAVKASLSSHGARPPDTVDRAAFGLPLGFYFRSLGNKKARFLPALPQNEPRPPKLDRVPSPLLIRVHALAPRPHERTYGVTLINLAGQRTTPLLGCKIRQDTKPGLIDAPAATILDDFIAYAVAQSKGAPLGSPPARRRRRHR